MTGEFVLEVNASGEDILALVDAARSVGETATDSSGCYRVLLNCDGEVAYETDKRTLLVYDDDGSLLRQHSLIPSGVEL